MPLNLGKYIMQDIFGIDPALIDNITSSIDDMNSTFPFGGNSTFPFGGNSTFPCGVNPLENITSPIVGNSTLPINTTIPCPENPFGDGALNLGSLVGKVGECVKHSATIPKVGISFSANVCYCDTDLCNTIPSCSSIVTETKFLFMMSAFILLRHLTF